MKIKHGNLNKVIQKNRFGIIIIASVVLISITGGGVFALMNQRPQEVDNTTSAETHAPAAAVRPPVDTPVSDIANPSPTPEPAKPSYSPDSIMGEKERMKDPTYRAAHLAPMVVKSVTYYGGGNVVNCGAWNTKTLNIQYVNIMTNSALGGTIKYQLEERQNGVVNVLFAGTGFVEDLGTFYETPSLLAYSASGDNPDSAIRVHVTSPNDISSPWYPTGACPRVGP